jgi:hypothetical protein
MTKNSIDSNFSNLFEPIQQQHQLQPLPPQFYHQNFNNQFLQQNMYQQQFQLPSHQPLLFQPQLYQPLFQPQFLHQSQFLPHHSSSQQQPTQQFQNLEVNKEAKTNESINQRIKSIQSIQNENFLHHDKFASTEDVSLNSSISSFHGDKSDEEIENETSEPSILEKLLDESDEISYQQIQANQTLTKGQTFTDLFYIQLFLFLFLVEFII